MGVSGHDADRAVSAGWPPLRQAACGTALGLRVSRQFQCSDGATRAALIAITQRLRQRQVLPEALETLELVLAEVLNNLVEHGYDERGGSVDLSVTIASDGLRCRIADQGRRAPCAALTGSALPDASTMPEGGWGWYLVCTMSENIEYTQENGWNVLRLTIPWYA